jgi:thioredoxin-like negative regulator of GroEL
MQKYAMVRQILTLRQRLDQERDNARWEYMARALHSFYAANGLYVEALALDKKMHDRLRTAASAVMVAETQLAMDRNAEASEVLAALEPQKHTPASRAIHGIALARQGKTDEARTIAETIAPPRDATAGTLYAVARLEAAVGDTQDAADLLTRCFESVPPSRLDVFKNHARQNPEFAAMVSAASFARALETKSKVPESKCSGGSRCAGCPMRGNCPSSQGQ